MTWSQLFRSMAHRLLKALRWRFGSTRQTVCPPSPIAELRLDSVTPPPDPSQLLEPLATRLAGRAVVVAGVLETTGAGQRRHLLTIGPPPSNKRRRLKHR